MVSLMLPVLLYSAKTSKRSRRIELLAGERQGAYLGDTLGPPLEGEGSRLSVINQVTENLGVQLPGIIVFYVL